MNDEKILISVGWRFDKSDIDTRNGRVAMTNRVLGNNGCGTGWVLEM